MKTSGSQIKSEIAILKTKYLSLSPKCSTFHPQMLWSTTTVLLALQQYIVTVLLLWQKQTLLLGKTSRLGKEWFILIDDIFIFPLL